MKPHNAENERLKRRYFAYLREAKRYSEASVDMVAKALHRFETYARMRDFKAFHIEQAIAFTRDTCRSRSAHKLEPGSERMGDVSNSPQPAPLAPPTAC